MTWAMDGLDAVRAWPMPAVTLLACGALVWGGRALMTALRLGLGAVRRLPQMIASVGAAGLLHYLGWQCLASLDGRADGIYAVPGPDLRMLFLIPALLSFGAALSMHRGNAARAPALTAGTLYVGMLPLWDHVTPWPPAVTCLAVGAGVASTMLRGMTPRGHTLPWRRSIKDAADSLGDGLAFFDARDRPVLVNRRMTEITAGLGARPLTPDELWGEMAGAAVDGPADALSDEGALAFRAGGRVYVAERNRVLGRRGRWYTEVRAIDVTELAAANLELMAGNERLREAMAETRELLAAIEQIEREQVLLDFRTRLHDVVAQRVSVVQRFMDDGAGTPDRLRILGRMLADVRADIRDDHAAPATLLKRVRQSFATAGVDIDVAGDLPADPDHAAAAVRIIRQAATNAVAHGAASTVLAEFSDRPGGWRLTVSNDGDAPEGITEGTGLSGLRGAIEALGGTLAYSTGASAAPMSFSLVADVPHSVSER